MMRHTDWGARNTAAFEKALGAFLAGRPYLEHLHESKRCALEAMRASGIERVEILGCSDSCPACLAVAHQAMTVTEALKTVPLPVTGCTHRLVKREGWCRCLYVAIVSK
jgi:hypothetical protein